jgi:hypothetical protein
LFVEFRKPKIINNIKCLEKPIDNTDMHLFNTCMSKTNALPKVKILKPEEGKRLLDQQARLYLNMSGREFLRKWRAKEFDDPCSPDVMKVAFLLAE